MNRRPCSERRTCRFAAPGPALLPFACGGGSPRALLLGFDGLDSEAVDLLLSEGTLPNFARMRREGACVRLKSFEPMLSSIRWTTIATGRTPEADGMASMPFEGLSPGSVRRLRRSPTGRLAGTGVPLWYPLHGSGAEGPYVWKDRLEVRDQLQRLFASTFQCTFHDESQGRHDGDGFLIAEKRELWWDPRPRKGEAAWGSHVVLSDRFYREAAEAPVPLDLRVLRALRSPFEIDIYVWLTWRFFRLRKPVTIPWASLALQFGCGYANPRHFKKRFLGYLKSVIDYYPEVRLESSATGLLLKPSPTHIRQRPSKR